MFKKARLKLTAWYLIITVIILIFFSFVFYQASNREFRVIQRKFSEVQVQMRVELSGRNFPDAPPHNIRKNQENLLYLLILIDVIILFLTAILGYFLADKTLKPINKMMDEQYNFITAASHELRTPITIIRSETETYLMQNNLTAGQTKKLLASNLEELTNMQNLITSLLRLSQLESFTDLFPKEVLISELVNSIYKKMLQVAKNKKIELKLSISPKAVKSKVLAESTLMEEAIIVLTDNAIKYSPEGSVVEILCDKYDQKHIAIIIKDKGMGIDKLQQELIFEKFYQVDQSRSEVAGFGLGLPLSKKIIELHRGEITVKSRIGEGATFTICLPTIQD